MRAQPLRNQEWRDYLNGTHEVPPGQDVPEKRTNNSPSLAATAFIKARIKGGTPDAWYGHSLLFLKNAAALPVDERDRHTVHLVTWELHALAFRHELGELDSALVPLSPTDFEAIRERGSLISSVFPRVEDVIAQGYCGLTSGRPTDRAPRLDAFHKLVTAWPGGQELIPTQFTFTSTSSAILFDNMERLLLSFYCQTFFETSGRPPVVPRQFPSPCIESPSSIIEPSSSKSR